MRASLAPVVAVALLAGACTAEDPAAPGRAHRDDNDPLGLYRDFLDGKYDALGHPLGATVWEAERDCDTATGYAEAEGWAAWAGYDSPGALCGGLAAEVGRGRYTVNARALVAETGGDAATVFTIRVLDADGQVLAERDASTELFRAPMTYQNVPVTFTHYARGGISVEIEWPGERDVRVDYVELFRATRSLVVEPRSGVLAPDAELRIELIDPPADATLELRCGELDLTESLDALLEAGIAIREDGEFRAVVTAPADALLAECPRPARVQVGLVTGQWRRATSRVTYYDAAQPCGFADDSRRRVLLTGFEPFPADASHDNSSERAVMDFDDAARPGDAIMRMVLPVEWESAAALVTDAIERCEPDVVVGFGQGRSAVDVETTAYNVMDSAAIAGGTPDNRGVVMDGAPIAPAGPDTHTTGLPAAALRDALAATGIEAHESDDPGTYICNNLFYAIMESADARGHVGGFIHLPYITDVDAGGSGAMLQQVVELALAHAGQ